MAKVLLGVTGSVAAIRTPDLFAALRQSGHEVKVVATQASLYFFQPQGLSDSEKVVFRDEDEWPGKTTGRVYQRDDPVLHIELRRWADILLIAPLDANTLAKIAIGLCDNCLTCVWRAWDWQRPIVLAPAMNTLMWDHPLTVRHLQAFYELAVGRRCESVDLDALLHSINRHAHSLRIVGPQSKKLACGDVGLGAMSEVRDIVEMVNRVVS